MAFFALLWLWPLAKVPLFFYRYAVAVVCHYCCHWFSLPLSMARSVDDGARITYDEVEMLVVPVGARRGVLAAG